MAQDGKSRCPFYIRVSTLNGSQSTEMQVQELEQYAKARGFEIVSTYEDHATGAKDNRPAPMGLLFAIASIRYSPLGGEGPQGRF